jgi:predicted ester cyclase
MSAEQNKTIFRRYVEEIWNNGKLKAAGEIMAEQFAFHGPGRDLAGLEAFRQYVAAGRNAFPDLHFTIEDQIAEGDQVVTRWTLHGTHKANSWAFSPPGSTAPYHDRAPPALPVLKSRPVNNPVNSDL